VGEAVMVLNRFTVCQLFKIREPKWGTIDGVTGRRVYLKKSRIGVHNEIVFTNAPTYPDHYYISGEKVKQSPIKSNGVIDCYAPLMDDLELLERSN
jgi:hypothetical protein